MLKLVRSMQVSKDLHCFGCKLWLQLIQNHARDCFQAFAHCHMMLLCCLIGI